MKKFYYIHESCYNANGELVFFGVQNKIDMMIRELSQYFEVKEIVVDRKVDAVHKLIARLPFASNGYDYETALEKIKMPDCVYIRKPIIDGQFVEFVKKIKCINPQCKIMLEVFTYPYDHEYRLKRTYPLLLKERKNREKLFPYIDKVLTFGNYDEIFHMQTIKTCNGIDFESIPLPEYNHEFNPSGFTIISVATMQPVHGYERVIQGIHDYYSSEGEARITYKVVGNGSEVEHYKALVDKYGLNDKVIFVGAKKGDELTKEFIDADIAVEVLGGYKDKEKRHGNLHSSSLKSREYFARGIPFITASDMDLDEIKELSGYYFHVEEESDTVNIRAIIDFLNRTYGRTSRMKFANEMRKAGQKYLDYSITCLPIVEYFNQ